jgi:hypothetical protein
MLRHQSLERGVVVPGDDALEQLRIGAPRDRAIRPEALDLPQRGTQRFDGDASRSPVTLAALLLLETGARTRPPSFFAASSEGGWIPAEGETTNKRHWTSGHDTVSSTAPGLIPRPNHA